MNVELFVISPLEQVYEGGRGRERERMTALKLRNGHNFQQQILACSALSPFLSLTLSASSISSSSISSLHSSLYSSSSLSYSFLCHTHFVGCPQKGELKHVCQITHTHCVLCNLASAALCVCLRVCVAIRCCVPGCVIAFGAVFTCACIIRANVAHVIKSSGGRTRRRKCRALYAPTVVAVSAADII